MMTMITSTISHAVCFAIKIRYMQVDDCNGANTATGKLQRRTRPPRNPSDKGSNDLSNGAIAGIVIGSLLFAALLVVIVLFVVKKIKAKRKLEGKYFPAEEEQKSSTKNLPPLPPPAIEGLI
ncbi:unnamed protein product [Soboliphyme baturini]|uniref:Syndecan domain-containing protein n=1 Tax=Soboliphyme baturini TaxID=241478 RepID=A0A183IG19_9BILA|nr:unnamed protein product [Soboliphyme baturini]